jgi:hypothetical protein
MEPQRPPPSQRPDKGGLSSGLVKRFVCVRVGPWLIYLPLTRVKRRLDPFHPV